MKNFNLFHREDTGKQPLNTKEALLPASLHSISSIKDKKGNMVIIVPVIFIGFLILGSLYFFFQFEEGSFFWKLTSSNNLNQLRLPSNINLDQRFSHYEIKSIDGIEAELYDVEVIGTQVILTEKYSGSKDFYLCQDDYIDKQLADSIVADKGELSISGEMSLIEEPTQDLSKIDYSKCTTQRITQPTTIKLREADTLTDVKDTTTFDTITKNGTQTIINLDGTREYYKIGDNSIILVGTTSYDAIETNITEETGFAHLTTNDTRLQLYTPFDFDNNVTSWDYTGNSDGTYHGANVKTISGVFGLGVNFSNGNITFGDRFDNIPELTVSSWVYFNNQSQCGSDANSIQTLFVKAGRGQTANAQTSWYMTYDCRTTTNEMVYRVVNTSVAEQVVRLTNFNNTYLANTWYHFVWTRNTTGLFIYVNGALANSTVTARSGNIQNTAHPLRYGGGDSEAGTTPRNFKGRLDDVAIYNTSLTASEVADIYNNQSSRFRTRGEFDFGLLGFFRDTDLINITFNSCGSLVNSNITARFNTGTDKGNTGCAITNYNVSGLTNPMQLYINLIPSPSNFYSSVIGGNIEITGDTLPPYIQYIDYTPVNNLQTSNRNININTSIIDVLLESVIYNWNGTNYTIYDDSLKLMMNMDDYTRFNDTSITKNSLSCPVGSCPTFSNTGIQGSGTYVFDGSNDYLTAGDINSLEGTNQITVSTWFRTSTSQTNKGIIGKWAGDTSWVLLYGPTANNNIGFYVANTTTSANAQSGNDLNDNTWHHAVGTYNGSLISMYIDGQLVGTTAHTGTIKSTTESVILGAYAIPPGNYFTGSLDNVFIYNRTLNANEVNQLYMTNLYRYNATQWYINSQQVKNNNSLLDYGNYTYNIFAFDRSGNMNSTGLRNLILVSPPFISIPFLNFTSPTPVNNTQTDNSSVIINATINRGNVTIKDIIYNWNGTNYTWYDDSLILLMNFNNFTAYNDTSKYSNNATNAGSTQTTGKYDLGLNFDGASYVNIPDGAPQPSSYLTVSYWAKTSASQSNKGMIGRWSVEPSWIMRHTAAGGQNNRYALNIYVGGSGYETFSNGQDYNDNTWRHVVGRYNGTDIQVFVNGVGGTPTAVTGTIEPATSYYDIGVYARDVAPSYYSGDMDELMVWNRSLSDAEIHQLYMTNLYKYNNDEFIITVNQSRNSTTGLVNGTYTYQVFATNLTNGINSTEKRTVIIGTEPAPPTDTKPQYSNIVENPNDPNNYNAGQVYRFNSTWTDDNGIDTVKIEFNGVNYTVARGTGTATNGVYNFTITPLGVGTYNYYWWANDTTGQTNQTSVLTYTVNQATGSVTGLLNSTAGNINLTYGNSVNASGSSSTGQTIQILRNGVDVTSQNNQFILLSAGYYNYTFRALSNQNYTLAVVERFANISKATTSLSLTGTSPITYGTAGDVTGTNCPSQLTCNLYRDNVLVSNPDTTVLGAGTYNYIYNTTGNENYTSDSETFSLTVNQATGLVYAYANNTRSSINISQGDSIWLNGTLITGNGQISLYLQNSLINQGISPLSNLTLFSSVGYYNFTAYYSGNNNYTSDFETWFINVTAVPDTQRPQVTNLKEQPSDPATYVSGATYRFNATVTDNIGIGTVLFEFNGVNYSTISIGNVYTATLTDLGVGVYSYRWFANDTSGNVNNTETGSYTINKGSSSIFLYLNGSRSNRNYNVNLTDYNLTAIMQTPSTGQINLTINGTQVKLGNSPLQHLENFTYGTFIIKANYTGNANYTGSYEQWTLTLSVPSPPSNATVTSVSVCRYKKFGYYNIKLPWFREVNCI